VSDHDPSFASKLVSVLQRSGTHPPVFIDGGACRGEFTQLLLDAFPSATIHAFEPNEPLAAELALRFGSRANVHVWNRALHASIGAAELEVHADPGTSSLLPRARDARRYFHSSDAVLRRDCVSTLDLDSFAREHAPTGVTLLKLDTQGSELDILRGARTTLARHAIDVLYTEFFVVPHYAGAPLLGDLLAYLGSFGYTLFDLFKGPNARNGQLRFGDAIFVSPPFRANQLDAFTAEP
jgi:FkbM family methyltransferase